MREMTDFERQVMALVDARDYERALGLCGNVLGKEPRSAEALRKRAYVYGHMRDYESELRDCDALVSIGIADDFEQPSDYLRRGRCHLELGKFEDAVKDFSRVIELGERHSFYYDSLCAQFHRAYALFQLGRHGQALDDCRDLPDDYTTYARGEIVRKTALVESIKAGLAGDQV